MARSLTLLAVSALAVAALVAVAFRLDERERRAAPCAPPRAGELDGPARELRAGEGVWSAWLRYPPTTGQPLTVLWRVEGEGSAPFVLGGHDRDDRPLRVVFGPAAVIPPLAGGTLAWSRGGREWGSRILFDRPGCWTIDVAAGERRGELEVDVRS